MTMKRMPSTPEFTCLDLFAGCGGVSIGLESAGFRSLGAVELDPVAAQTFEANFGPRLIRCFGPEHGDIRTVDMTWVRRELASAGVQTLDLLVAAPPCQGFSRVGRGKLDSVNGRRGSFAHDRRNVLYENAVDAIRVLRPRAVLFENVSGILHLRGRNMAEVVCEAIESAGYTVRCALLNSAWYGVPQIRERIVIIALREDLGLVPYFPPKRHKVKLSRGHLTGADLDPNAWKNPEYFVTKEQIPDCSRHRAVSVIDALGDLPPFTEHLAALAVGGKYRARRGLINHVSYRSGPCSEFARLMRNWPPLVAADLVSDHFCRWTPRDFATFAIMSPGDRYPVAHDLAMQIYSELKYAAIRENRPSPRKKDVVPPYSLDGFPDKWRKLIPDEPSWTITAHLGKDTYSHIHYDDEQARTISMREAARLQSFPDAFRFSGNMGDVFRQIGNAVPPLLARALGIALGDQLRQSRQARQTSWQFIAQPPSSPAVAACVQRRLHQAMRAVVTALPVDEAGADPTKMICQSWAEK